MKRSLRNKQGCWTCRLRKKKCDEGRPHCSTCESLSIVCYGFGPKPDWMDGGEKERAVVNGLKATVRHTSRHKVAAPLSRQSDSIVKTASKSLNESAENSTVGPRSNRQKGLQSPLEDGLSQDENHITPQETSLDFLSEDNDHSMTGPICSIPMDESVLLMHFLDIVFPLQYPMYKPGILEGGRGWLLTILLHTKPLYYAALALSIYYRRAILSEMMSHSNRVAAVVQQEKHLDICLQSINQAAQNSCPKMGLGVTTSVVQLVFFELFTGHSDAWKAHLRAATNMYERGYQENWVRYGLTESSRKILFENNPFSEYEPGVAEEVAAFKFMASSIVWLDITSSITAGTVPQLLHRHSSIFGSSSFIKLEDIMGCKNQVMVLISRICMLHERKTSALQPGRLDCSEYAQIQHDITKEIQYGLTQVPLGHSDSSTLVTLMFAFMAYVYHHLISYGFQELDLLDSTISGAIQVVNTQISTHLLLAVVSPLYIIGSVARTEDEQFFRNIFSSPPLLDPVLQHRQRISLILEEIWSRRRTTPGFTWKDSLELSSDVLLV